MAQHHRPDLEQDLHPPPVEAPPDPLAAERKGPFCRALTREFLGGHLGLVFTREERKLERVKTPSGSRSIMAGKFVRPEKTCCALFLD